jgi:hypothetical protein
MGISGAAGSAMRQAPKTIIFLAARERKESWSGDSRGGKIHGGRPVCRPAGQPHRDRLFKLELVGVRRFELPAPASRIRVKNIN